MMRMFGVAVGAGLLALAACAAPTSAEDAADAPMATPPTTTVTATATMTVTATSRVTVRTTATVTRTVRPVEPVVPIDRDVTNEFIRKSGMPASAIVRATLRGSEVDVLTTYPPDLGVPIDCGDMLQVEGVKVTVERWRTRDLEIEQVCR